MLRSLILAATVAFTPAFAFAEEKPSPLEPGETWEAIRGDIIGDGEILDGSGLYALEAPFRANDAATVPIHITQADTAPDVLRLYLVVDENPSPLAAEFTFGPAMSPLDIEARVRVDAYSNVRAIVAADDGKLYMTGRYVRGSGGCSAPGAKDAAAALAALGQMKARWFDDAPAQSLGRREAQVMLRHPNNSGLQRDPLTLLYIPPHFVDSMEVRQGDDLLFSMTGGISISEDPTFRFTYADSGVGELSVTATDTEGATFEGRFPIGM
jgi:sulfur-oxidizing protein SoxY